MYIFLAFHEAGHAVAGWNLEYADPLLKVIIYTYTKYYMLYITCILTPYVLYMLCAGHHRSPQLWSPRIRPVPAQGDLPTH